LSLCKKENHSPFKIPNPKQKNPNNASQFIWVFCAAIGIACAGVGNRVASDPEEADEEEKGKKRLKKVQWVAVSRKAATRNRRF